MSCQGVFSSKPRISTSRSYEGLCYTRIMEAQVCLIVLLVTGGLLKASRSRMLSWFFITRVEADTDIDTNDFNKKGPSVILEARLTTTPPSASYRCVSLFASAGFVGLSDSYVNSQETSWQLSRMIPK